jgi:hypothetical protein
MSNRHDFVAIEASQVTVRGAPEDVERLATAAGLYGAAADARPMSKDEDHIMTGVYIGVGLLLAVGAGYLAWRYALSDEQKTRVVNSTKDLIEDGVTQARRSVRDARAKVHL